MQAELPGAAGDAAARRAVRGEAWDASRQLCVARARANAAAPASPPPAEALAGPLAGLRAEVIEMVRQGWPGPEGPAAAAAAARSEERRVGKECRL